MIDIRDLTLKYSDGHRAIDAITFNIKQGESVALVGANGAGKSTLLLSMVGIIANGSGHIKIDGIELDKKSVKEIRKKLGMVFQNPDDQLFTAKVYDDVAFGPRNYGLSEDEVDKLVMKSLECLGIEHLKDRMSHKLSGGEKRTAAIASVMSLQPEAVLMDEPTSFLDPRARRKLIGVMKKMYCTKLIATHDLDMAMEVCDRVLVLKDGKLFADGKTEEILRNEKMLLEVGLELPFGLQRIEK
ncbi:MAG: energy-coupling factor ABC transporter ATP-binding protein [Anaerotignaceae bacterium]